MCAAVRIEDVVGECFDRFGEGISVLHSDFYLYVINHLIYIKHIVINYIFAKIKMLYIRLDAAFEVKTVAVTGAVIDYVCTQTFSQVGLVA